MLSRKDRMCSLGQHSYLIHLGFVFPHETSQITSHIGNYKAFKKHKKSLQENGNCDLSNCGTNKSTNVPFIVSTAL